MEWLEIETDLKSVMDEQVGRRILKAATSEFKVNTQWQKWKQEDDSFLHRLNLRSLITTLSRPSCVFKQADMSERISKLTRW